MPLSYAVSEADNLVRVKATGVVNSEDLPRLTSSLIADKTIVRGMRIVVEAADVAPDVTFTDLRAAAATLESLNKKGVSALAIVTDTTHVYALAQVFAVFVPAATVPVKVFRSGDEAAAWLESGLAS